MENKVVHIIAFDIPYPANYGGVIDVYYKLKALKARGVQIILHCFYKNRKPSSELNKVCREVHYYQRDMNPYLALSKKPFIVSSRKEPRLMDKLLRDDYPVLFEGLHTTYFLKDIKKAGRKCYVRTHNVEHDYYRDLAKSERSKLKQEFFKIESRKLKKYEAILSEANGLIAISEGDEEYFKELNENTVYIPPFHPELEVIGAKSKQNYAFYHGNLEVSENRKAAEFLVNQVLPELKVKLVIAGKGAKALRKTNSDKDIIIIDSPSQSEMLKWASEAAVHLLPTFQPTGYKLKLLYSLYTAGSIIANNEMVHGTGLENFVTLANTAEEWKKSIQLSLEKPRLEPIASRDLGLRRKISNDDLAEKLIQFLF